jgi:hypothetical protein
MTKMAKSVWSLPPSNYALHDSAKIHSQGVGQDCQAYVQPSCSVPDSNNYFLDLHPQRYGEEPLADFTHATQEELPTGYRSLSAIYGSPSESSKDMKPELLLELNQEPLLGPNQFDKADELLQYDPLSSFTVDRLDHTSPQVSEGSEISEATNGTLTRPVHDHLPSQHESA